MKIGDSQPFPISIGLGYIAQLPSPTKQRRVKAKRRKSSTCAPLLLRRLWILIGAVFAPRITVTFDDDKDKSSKTVQVPIGTSLLEAAHANDIDLEGGMLMVALLVHSF
jgi:hypothetical protein